MNEYYLGIGLMILGAVLFFIGRSGSRRTNVHASGGSVAVGRDNNGPITNTNTNQPSSNHSGGHGITIVAIVVELAGISVTLWHAFHLAAK